MLCEHLWEADWEGVTNVVEVHINRLRGKIDRGFDQPLIQTVRGRGYVLRSDLAPLRAPGGSALCSGNAGAVLLTGAAVLMGLREGCAEL